MSNVTRYSRPGIYLIIHKESGRAYVGQSVNIYSRWSVHKAQLRTNTHHCEYLQRAWNKYGEESFEFRVVQLSSKDLNSKETKWYNRFKGRLFNTRPPGDGCSGFNHTIEAIEKMKVSAKRAGNTPEQKLMRSERAKRQHAQGILGRRKTEAHTIICEMCSMEFKQYRMIPRGWHSGKRCLVCMAQHHRRYGGRFNIGAFDVTVDEFDNAAYELTW